MSSKSTSKNIPKKIYIKPKGVVRGIPQAKHSILLSNPGFNSLAPPDIKTLAKTSIYGTRKKKSKGGEKKGKTLKNKTKCRRNKK